MRNKDTLEEKLRSLKKLLIEKNQEEQENLDLRDLLSICINMGNESAVRDHLALCHAKGKNLRGMGLLMLSRVEGFGQKWENFCEEMIKKYPQLAEPINKKKMPG